MAVPEKRFKRLLEAPHKAEPEVASAIALNDKLALTSMSSHATLYNGFSSVFRLSDDVLVAADLARLTSEIFPSTGFSTASLSCQREERQNEKAKAEE